jgi:peptidylprolyl isomerase
MKKRTFLLLAAAAATMAVGVACGDGPDDPPPASVTPTATPPPTGTAIVLENPTVTASGLQYVDDVIGTGATPTEGQIVTVHYVGWLASNGVQFDSSRDRGEPSSFPLDGVIDGFAEAILTMKVGGMRTAYIPAALAYGDAGRGELIPPNSDLVFEIELISID